MRYRFGCDYGRDRCDAHAFGGRPCRACRESGRGATCSLLSKCEKCRMADEIVRLEAELELRARKPSRINRTRTTVALCPLCDATYDPLGPDAATHLHPEPQSGAARDAWLASRLPYERWIVETDEGKAWKERTHGNAEQSGG